MDGNPPAFFHSSDSPLCFAFRLLFFFLALNVGPSNVAKFSLALGLFIQLVLGRLLPTWPSHGRHLPAFGEAFLLVSHRLSLTASGFENR